MLCYAKNLMFCFWHQRQQNNFSKKYKFHLRISLYIHISIFSKRFHNLFFNFYFSQNTAPKLSLRQFGGCILLAHINYGLHRLQGTYPSKINSSRIPLNNILFSSFISSTDEQLG